MEPFGPLDTGFAHPVGASGRDWSYGQHQRIAKGPVSKDPRDTVILGWRGRARRAARKGHALSGACVALPPRLQAVPLSEDFERHRLQAALWSFPKLEQHSTDPHHF